MERDYIIFNKGVNLEMIILYISALPKTMSGGPRYSVPQQIAAQAKFDNVHWINLNNNGVEESKIKCNIIEERYKFRLDSLESPFDKPDLVIFEGVYYLEFCLIGYELRMKKIPYIIIPRGSLTKSAQKVKAVKKRLANVLIFKRFINRATAIQYLTEAEHIASEDTWNKNNIVIPNGTKTQKHTKVWGRNKSLRGVFIGRMNMYHKGLDYLMKACIQLKETLIEYRCTINLYGPDRLGAKKILTNQIENNGLDGIVFIRDEIYGKEKERILLESDFFILTSRFEGQPMGLIEAIAYGLPCLVTMGSNMANEIVGANAGWAADNNANSVMMAMRELLANREQLPEFGKNSLALASRYDWNELARQSSEKYKNLLNTSYHEKIR